jgi:hypothetical protein
MTTQKQDNGFPDSDQPMWYDHFGQIRIEVANNNDRQSR